MLGERPGLGRWLFLSLDGKIPVIGVAKSPFRGSSGVPLFRGNSVRPLYVTSAGVEPKEACERIRRMHGLHRVPTLLKRVDLLANQHAERSRREGRPS
jgi:deoxyribonuclease V